VLRRKSAKQTAKPKKEKKPKAARKAKPARKPKPSGGVVVQKAPTDIYSVMLMISFGAVLVACLLLWLELSSYGSWPQWRAS
jgi:hypothetical protein